jgi:hypothetical protein
MEKKHDKGGGEWVNNMPVRSENMAFSTEEMITCGTCSRLNPPNRLKCLYCAAELEISGAQADQIVPSSRKLESWEKGYNLVFIRSTASSNEISLTEVSKAVSLDAEVLGEIIDANRPMPIARVESEKEAEVLTGILDRKGVETSIIADGSLAEDVLPKRLRNMRFESGLLTVTLFNTGETEEIKSTSLALIVTGAIFEQRTETIEKRKKRETRTLEEWETASDEGLIDIYTFTDPAGFRIPAKGFDFSCLGSSKGILAGENIRSLVARLREFAPEAKLVDGYLSDKRALGHVWDVERRSDFKGFRRSGFGKSDLAKTASSSNLGQFTKYSRLQWHLL